MNDADLVRMANQIALFHAAYPQERAVAGVSEHLQQFWTPEMYAQLAALGDVGSLHPLVVSALQQDAHES